MPGTPVLAVIDTETTGFNKRYDRLIELAAVRADAHFTPVGFWHTLLNPDGKAIKNSHIHSITNDTTSNLRQCHRHCLQPLYGNTQRSYTLNPTNTKCRLARHAAKQHILSFRPKIRTGVGKQGRRLFSCLAAHMGVLIAA